MTAPARARLTLRYETPAQAEAMRAACEPENAGYVRARVEGATVVAEAEAPGPGPLLHTLDDLLASIGAAEKVLRAADE